MDPLGARPDTVDADGIERWGDTGTVSDPLTTAAATSSVLGSELPCAHATPPFPMRVDLNHKVAYWSVSLGLLRVRSLEYDLGDGFARKRNTAQGDRVNSWWAWLIPHDFLGHACPLLDYDSHTHSTRFVTGVQFE